MTADPPLEDSLVETPFQVRVRYEFDFPDGTSALFDTEVDLRSSERAIPEKEPPPWTRLECHQCENCTLSADRFPFCPAALSIHDIVEYFSRNPGFRHARCSVILPEKKLVVDKPVQEILSCLMGLRMATSLCPYLSKLKLMARFHDPFATPFCTVYRATSTYLLRQYFLKSEGKDPDWDLKGLIELYENLGLVNQRIAERLKETAGMDCAPCSMTVLSVFTVSMTLLFEEYLKVLKQLENTPG